MKKNTTKVLKEANKYLVMQCIQAYAPLTTEEISAKTSLSRPTVLETVKGFLEEGYIVKKGFTKSTGGRPAELICINENSAYAVGIDFEFPKVRIALSDISKNIISRQEIKFHLDCQAEEVLSRLSLEIHKLMDTSGVDKEKIIGIGLGISGTIQKSTGKSLHITRICGWDNINICERLETEFHLPVYMKNDVHLLALIEKQKYVPAETGDFVYIGIRSGIGSAIFYHNSPLDGINGNAGYIGHTILEVNGAKCVCGSRGCLDAYAGELALNKQYLERKKLKKSDVYYTMTDFLKMEKEGNQDCADILKNAAVYLGIGISNLLKTLEIETVVIGGCPNLKGSQYWRILTETIRQNLTNDMELNPNIHIGRLDKEEYPLGACCYVFEHLFEKPKLSLAVN